MSVLREDEWGVKQIAERLRRFADRCRVPVDHVVSVKVRPVANGEQTDAPYDLQHEGQLTVHQPDIGRNWLVEVERHETGPEFLFEIAALAGIIGTIVMVAQAINAGLGRRQEERQQQQRQAQTAVLIQHRTLRSDGSLEERTVHIINPPPELLERLFKPKGLKSKTAPQKPALPKPAGKKPTLKKR